MAHFIDIVCSYLDFTTLIWIIITLVIGIFIAIIFKYSDFSHFTSYFQLSVLTTCVIIFFLLFDTICVYPNAKAAMTSTSDSDILSIECLVPRKAELDYLRSDLQGFGYFLLEGHYGSGKTTLLRMLKSSLINESSKAVLYVSIPYDGDVAQGLYSALRIEEYCDSAWAKMLSYMRIPSPVCAKKERLEYALQLLMQVCSDVHDATGIAPLIIFDNTARILKKKDGKRTLSHLQDMAKEAVDSREYMNVLFLSSESSVPNILRSRSAKSRMHSTLYVGDISDEEAIEYIACMCKNASKELVTRAVHYFGGRFIHLWQAATHININGDAGLQKLIQRMYGELDFLFASLPFSVKNKLEIVLTNITQSPTKTITSMTYLHGTGLSKDDRDLIDMKNILNVNPGNHSVFFASRIVGRYFEEYYIKYKPV